MPSTRIMAAVTSVVALASCATLSGLDGKEAVDCPGGCLEGGTIAPDGSVTGPPKCDPATDLECMPLPAGWSFVARAVLAGGRPPACPSGMTTASTVDEGPSTQGDSCTCDSCSVTAPATCSGVVQHSWGDGAGSLCNDGMTSPLFYKNPVVGNCYTDLPSSWGEAERNRFVLPAPSGGTCGAAPTKHVARVTYGASSMLCDDTSRCSGGVCDGRIDAPFETCVARPGDEACPTGFAQKHVVGTDGAEFECGTCSCTVNRAACQGSVQHSLDNACANIALTLTANGTCGGPNTQGFVPNSYKVVATSTTTCATAAATTTATNARMKNARTVCCRQ